MLKYLEFIFYKGKCPQINNKNENMKYYIKKSYLSVSKTIKLSLLNIHFHVFQLLHKLASIFSVSWQYRNGEGFK